MNLDVVGNLIHKRSIRSREARLLSDQRRDDALEQGLGVDDGDAAEGRLGGVLPVLVADDDQLEGRGGDCHLQERAGLCAGELLRDF